MKQPAREFWGSTPSRVNAFFEQHARDERMRDARAGVIASVVANAHRGRQQRPVTPADFFHSLKPAGGSREMTASQMRAAVSRHFGLKA